MSLLDIIRRVTGQATGAAPLMPNGQPMTPGATAGSYVQPMRGYSDPLGHLFSGPQMHPAAPVAQPRPMMTPAAPAMPDMSWLQSVQSRGTRQQGNGAFSPENLAKLVMAFGGGG